MMNHQQKSSPLEVSTQEDSVQYDRLQKFMDRGAVIGLLGGLVIAQICRENSENYQDLSYSSRLLIGLGAGFMSSLAGTCIGSTYHYFRYIHNGN